MRTYTVTEDGWITDCAIDEGDTGDRCSANDGLSCDACHGLVMAEMARNYPGDTRNQPSPEDVRTHVPGTRVYP